MVKGYHLQLRCHPLLAHLPVIQKEFYKILAKCMTDLCTSDAGFYSNVYVVPGLWVGYDPYLIFCDSITTCTYLL